MKNMEILVLMVLQMLKKLQQPCRIVYKCYIKSFSKDSYNHNTQKTFYKHKIVYWEVISMTVKISYNLHYEVLKKKKNFKKYQENTATVNPLSREETIVIMQQNRTSVADANTYNTTHLNNTATHKKHTAKSNLQNIVLRLPIVCNACLYMCLECN